MRVPILAAVAASVALFALAAVAHGWVEERDSTFVTVRQCQFPAHVAVRCGVAVAPPVKERVARVRHQEDVAAWRADHDLDMYEDHGMAMRRDEGDRGVRDDRGRASADGAIHHEDEDRRGWDDREYALRDWGPQRDSGDAHAHVYEEQRGRTFAHGEHWLGNCGCGPARPTARGQS
jgi:hypothetical protein